MKRIISTTLILIATTLSIAAQPSHMGGDGEQRRNGGGGGGLHTMQCNQIINILQINKSKSEEFRKIYMDHIEAMQALRTAPPTRVDESEITEEMIEERILDSFENSIKVMEVRREYYKKYRSILKPSEIETMYHIERKIRDRAVEELFQRDKRQGDQRQGNIPHDKIGR